MVVLLVSFLSGCSTTMSSSPFFYSNNSNYEFIILGEVTYESKTKYGFQELLKAARSKYPNCDYVIDVMVDSTIETTSYLLSFLFKTKTVVTYSMRGTAIQYIRRNTNGEIISTPTATTNQNSSNILSVKENNNTVTFPSSIIGTWKRNEYENTLTFSSNSIKSSTSSNPANLISISGDLYTFVYISSNRTFSITIKFIDQNIEISGGTGTGQSNWNGIWRKQ